MQHFIFYVLTLGGIFASVSYLRFICLAESFLGFCFLYKLAKNYFGSFAAFGALLVYALCPYQILYTLYIRFYALNMTLVIMEIYFYFRALEKEDWKKLWLPALFAALAYCTHQFSVFIQPVFLVHFLIFCLARRPNKANAKWFIWSALTLAFIACLAFCAPALAKKMGLIFGAKDAWLPVKLGIASQRLQLFFWKNALPVKCCSLVFLWVSLGLSAAARLARRQKLGNELFLALGIIVPFFFLSHLHFSHFFAERYLAFWFPVWCLAWSCYLEFPAAMLENLKALENRKVLRNICYGVFILVFTLSLFRFSALIKMRYLEYGNTEAVEYLESVAAKKNLPLIIITEPDAASRNNILPQYYFDVKDHEGNCYTDLVTVMRKGAAKEQIVPSAVVWTQSAKRLNKPEGTERRQIGFHEIVSGGVFTNWSDIALATGKVIPSSASLVKPLPKTGSNILDVGAKEADPYLLTGFSNDEYLSPEENYAWCVGTNITVRFHNMPHGAFALAARVRAIKKMRADFFLNGAKIGSAAISSDFTNIILKAENVPPSGKDVPLILKITTSGSFAPGRVGKNVFDSRELSLCFDRLILAKRTSEEELGAAIYLKTPKETIKAGSVWPLQIELANIGTHNWSKAGERPVRLAVRWYDESGKEIRDDRIWLPKDVPSCYSLQLECETKAPEKEGRYTVRFGMVHENVRFFPDDLTMAVVVEGKN